jgi:hypothetical protein
VSREAIVARVRAAVDHGADAGALALDVFRYQRAHNATYSRMADGDPASVYDIPAVPVALFQTLELASFSLELPHVTFRTSGTTGAVRGVQRLLDTAVYDHGAWANVTRVIPDLPADVVSLCPTDADSSLGHMVGQFARGSLDTLFHDGAIAADAWARVSRREPIFLATTAFALDALFQMDGAAELHPRSVVMVTGGFKGRRVRLDAPELYAAIPARLGPARIVGEYGMTELSSQLWTAPGHNLGNEPFVAPSWMTVYTVDPTTGERVDGEGLLRFVDPCNVDSVVAIETMDVGRVDGQRVWLKGRLAGAEARGCSLRAEELLRR